MIGSDLEQTAAKPGVRQGAVYGDGFFETRHGGQPMILSAEDEAVQSKALCVPRRELETLSQCLRGPVGMPEPKVHFGQTNPSWAERGRFCRGGESGVASFFKMAMRLMVIGTRYPLTGG